MGMIKKITCSRCKEKYEIYCDKSYRPKKADKVCQKCEQQQAPYGYVRLELSTCKTVGSLASLRRDFASKGEKERMDHEYASSSTLAAKKLHEDKHGTPGFLGASDKTMKKLEKASKKELQNYVLKGNI